MFPQEAARPPILLSQPYEIIFKLYPNFIKFLLPSDPSSQISESHLKALEGMPFYKYQNIQEL